MSKPDSTASERMKRWRNELKRAGWKSYTILLPPDDAAALDCGLADSTDSRRDTLTRILTAGIEADDSAALLADAEREIARLKASVDRLTAETATLTHADREVIGIAVQYLIKSRNKARKHTGEQLHAILERFEP